VSNAGSGAYSGTGALYYIYPGAEQNVTAQNCYAAGAQFDAAALGAAFQDDANNINGGHPILWWESIVVEPPLVGAPGSGDLNGDGVVTAAEALTAARAAVSGIVAAELDDAQVAALDMDSDGNITMADVVIILRKAVGL
jgi:hypothetical protein